MTVPVVKEHKKITDEIDDMYVAAINSAARLRTFMVMPRGADMREYFLIFYNSFYGLFLHTHKLPGMTTSKKEVQIMMWFKISGPITLKRIELGLDLFATYQGELLDNSIVAVTR